MPVSSDTRSNRAAPMPSVVQRLHGERLRTAVAGAFDIHQFRMVMHHQRSLHFPGVVVPFLEKIPLRNDPERIGNSDQEIGVFERQIAHHVTERIAAMSVQHDQPRKPLPPQRSDDVAQHGALGFVAGMQTKRLVPLSRILRPQRNGRQHDRANAAFRATASPGSVDGQALRQQQPVRYGRCRLCRLRSAPRQHRQTVRSAPEVSIAAAGKIDAAFIGILHNGKRSVIEVSTPGTARSSLPSKCRRAGTYCCNSGRTDSYCSDKRRNRGCRRKCKST